MNIAVITLFPEMFKALEFGIPGRALKEQLMSLQLWNPRDFTHDTYHRVDDRPYGGGPGMVLKTQPLVDAISAAKNTLTAAKTIYLSPQGKTLTQTQIQHWSTEKELIFVSGRYEGLDERIIELMIDEEWSIGDYVLSGGEFPAMVIIDALSRCLPGALGDENSREQDSFTSGLLDYPHYTRPEEFAQLRVPDVLLCGNHQAIHRWRLKQALARTWLRRPDLLANHSLDAEKQALLDEFIKENQQQQEKK
ncbi:MAG: tRNA (guanosine(37)-N1)-methyltransferase TrmD [Gammaproteobacteria bacterium]|nr:tRNA (guanosine(37)-N1)-methyltransferase TrmD [Gammaproteobacteria bacterium]